MNPRQRSHVKRVAVASVDPKMWIPLIAAGLSWWNGDGKLQKQKYDEGARYAVSMAQTSRLEARIDSLSREVKKLHKAARRGVIAVVETVEVEPLREPGIARKLFSFLWRPFQGGK